MTNYTKQCHRLNLLGVNTSDVTHSIQVLVSFSGARQSDVTNVLQKKSNVLLVVYENMINNS